MSPDSMMRAHPVKYGAIITVFSTASGVGKTLTAVNLAAEMAREGFSVCLVDLDLQFGDVTNYLQIQPDKTIFDAQRDVQKIGQDIDYFSYTTVVNKKGVNFYTLPAPKLLEEAYNIDSASVKVILENLQKEFDYILLDTTASFNELNLMAIAISPLVAFIGIMDFLPTIKNMRIGCDTLKNIGYDSSKLRFILNRSDSKTQIELEDVEVLLGESFTKVVPNDFKSARESILSGNPLVLEEDLRPIGVAFRELATVFTGRTDLIGTGKGKKGGFFSRLFGG